LTSALWLSPSTCEDALSTVSQLLGKEVPCPGKEAASKVRAASAEQCQGVLKDDTVRENFAQVLETFDAVSSSSGAALVEKLGLTLAKSIGAIKAEAKDLQLKGGLQTYEKILAGLPKGKKAGEALKSDWLLWHTVGHQQDAKQLPAPVEAVVSERLKLAVAAGGGPLADLVLGLHVLENVEAYIKWEAALPGSKAGKDGLEVLRAFDSGLATEVAVRRVLSTGGLPPAIAAEVAAKAPKGTGIPTIIKELSAAAKAAAVLPAYVAPPAPKEKKGDKGKADGGEGGGKKEGKKDKGGAKEAAPAAAAPAADKGKKSGGAPAAAAAGPYGIAASQEMMWHLVQYQMRPRTTLGEAALNPPAKSVAAGAAAVKKGAVSSSAGKASCASEAPKGFAGCWAPVGDSLPPGHTPYSWSHAQAKGMKENCFQTAWAPVGTAQPPGHTPYSWEKVLSVGA